MKEKRCTLGGKMKEKLCDKKGNLTKEGLKKWMKIYHDKWIDCHNKLVVMKGKR